ncbi:MAG: hypothetical protein HY847_08525 [Betaproteobacteria bacterium]|nr:hypothetical protein [Betaproteobacteria bacterium]
MIRNVVVAFAFAFALVGCGGGGGGGVVACGAVGCGGTGSGSSSGSSSSTTIPISVANSPLIGVTMRVDCANGIAGSGSIGDSANPGIGTLVINDICTAPIKISVSGSGKMRPFGALSDGSEDLPYDPAVNFPISAVLTTLPSTSLPAVVNPVTTLTAEKLVPGTASPATLSALTSAMLNASQVAVAGALGVGSSEVGQDYRNANIAAAAARLVEVFALAAAQVANNGMPAALSNGSNMSELLAQGLANQAATGVALTTAAGIAAATKNIDPAVLDAAKSAMLARIDDDSNRMRNLIALAQASSAANSLADISNNAARMVADARAAITPNAQQQQLIGNANARLAQAALTSIQSSAARMVADVANAAANLAAAERDTKNAIARAAANKVINDWATTLTQAGTRPIDQAAQGKAVVDSVGGAIKSDIGASSPAFATPPAIGASHAAAALVGQAQKTVAGVTAKSLAGFDAAAASKDVLKVGLAIKDVIGPPTNASPAVQKAFEAAVTSIAAVTDGASASNSSTNTAKISATISVIQAQLLAAMGGANAAVDSSTVELAQQIAQKALQTALGASGLPLNFAAPPASNSIIVASTLPTTTTTTTSTLMATSTAGSTTTTSLPTCDPLASPPSAGSPANCTNSTTTTTTSSTKGTTTTAGTTTTTTLPQCDPFSAPPVAGSPAICRP